MGFTPSYGKKSSEQNIRKNMKIAILNYRNSSIDTITGCPDDWTGEEVMQYLTQLGYKEEEISYMCSDSIEHTEREYTPVTANKSIYQQWKDLKEKHPDTLLLFRCGDFYEIYNEDAEKASKILGIALTNRHTKELGKIAGFPHHAIDTYLPKLIKRGERVAICDQIESPKK